MSSCNTSLYNQYKSKSKLKKVKGVVMATSAGGIKKTVKKAVVKKTVKKSAVKIEITTEMIAKKAFELYEKRGYQNGNPEDDWYEAKRLLEAGK